MIDIQGYDADTLYNSVLINLRLVGVEEESRNGPVISYPDPMMITLYNPRNRVLFNPVRDANPFFHVMEFVWMMGGWQDVRFLLPFNKNFVNFTDDGNNQNAAYGYRWANHFSVDQIKEVAKKLKASPTTRRAVVGMWDPNQDLTSNSVDVPCNTQLMFRIRDGKLNMLVTNRSNDVIWGMLGANIVHMTLLQELIAEEVGVDLGWYKVISNNAHIYKNLPRFKEIWTDTGWDHSGYESFPVLGPDEDMENFVLECDKFVTDGMDGKLAEEYVHQWLNDVARPMYLAYRDRQYAGTWLDRVKDQNWREAGRAWLQRRVASKPEEA